MQISALQFSLEGWFIINATEYRWREKTISPGVRSGGHRVDVGIPLPFGCLAFQTILKLTGDSFSRYRRAKCQIISYESMWVNSIASACD